MRWRWRAAARHRRRAHTDAGPCLVLSRGVAAVQQLSRCAVVRCRRGRHRRPDEAQPAARGQYGDSARRHVVDVGLVEELGVVCVACCCRTELEAAATAGRSGACCCQAWRRAAALTATGSGGGAQGFFTVGNRVVYRGYRCYRWGTVTVPIGSNRLKNSNLNLNSKK
jgi:hypothetical protein